MSNNIRRRTHDWHLRPKYDLPVREQSLTHFYCRYDVWQITTFLSFSWLLFALHKKETIKIRPNSNNTSSPACSLLPKQEKCKPSFPRPQLRNNTRITGSSALVGNNLGRICFAFFYAINFQRLGKRRKNCCCRKLGPPNELWRIGAETTGSLKRRTWTWPSK